MASGVYRGSALLRPESAQIEYHRDGKTASVSMVRVGTHLGLHTNGKPDATLNVSGKGPPRSDELAQVLSAVLPLAAHPAPRTAANIGFGSGATSHVLLSSRSLREVDSIEIEPFVVEAARGFLPRNELAYSDPRSRIFYEDAKTFFSIHDKRYDIIVSEPSNPWVSGTASLFTEEFYARVRRHLNEGGVFAQWLQMYEINPGLVASILKALARHFPEYTVYAATDMDFIVLARREGRPELAPERVFAEPALVRELERVAIRNAADLTQHRLATHSALQPYFGGMPVPSNSDYFPYLEFRAPRARFIKEWVGLALDLSIAPVPSLEMLSRVPAPEGTLTPGPRNWLRKALQREVAQSVLRHLLTGQPEEISDASPDLKAQMRIVKLLLLDCARPEMVAQASEAAFAVARVIIPVLGPGELRPLWKRMLEAPCAARLPEQARAWLHLYAAVSERDAPGMARGAEALLEAGKGYDAERRTYLLAAALTGRIAAGDREGALRAWRAHAGSIPQPLGLQMEFLAGHLTGT
jgi:spermidine synthase